MPNSPKKYNFSYYDIFAAKPTLSLSHLTRENWRSALNPQWEENTVTIADASFLRTEKLNKPEKKVEEEKKTSLVSLTIDSREKSGLNASPPRHPSKEDSDLTTNAPQVNVIKRSSTCSTL